MWCLPKEARPSLPSDLTPYGARQPRNRREQRAAALARYDVEGRLCAVHDDGLVNAAQLRELDHLAFTAMTGQAMLSKAASAMSQGDPFLESDLRYFSDIARLAKGELLAEAAEDMRRRRR